MKKILGLFGAISLTVVSGTTVVACGDNTKNSVEPKELSEVISRSNLGAIDGATLTPTAEEVIKGIKAVSANQNLNESQVTVSAISSTSATITVNENSTVYKPGTINVTYTIRVELNFVLKETMLGEITTSTGQNPSADQILDAAVAKNSGLDKTQLRVTNITNSSANILANANSTVYRGNSVAITFTIRDARPELNTIITQTALGELHDEIENRPTPAEIIAAIKAIAANRNLRESEVSVSQITTTSALITVNANSTVYKSGSSVRVTYTLDD